MAKVLGITTKTQHELGPGQTGHYWWNNAAPADAVWSANAVPVATGSTTAGFAQDTSLEVTRLWRRLIVTEKKPFPQSQTADVSAETEIHYEIKNLSSTKATFIVFLSAVAPA
jgi:hypothetical protein